MATYFAAMFEDKRHERSLIIILSLTDPDMRKQKTSYPSFRNEDSTVLKLTTKHDEIDELNYKTEKPDHEKKIELT